MKFDPHKQARNLIRWGDRWEAVGTSCFRREPHHLNAKIAKLADLSLITPPKRGEFDVIVPYLWSLEETFEFWQNALGNVYRNFWRQPDLHKGMRTMRLLEACGEFPKMMVRWERIDMFAHREKLSGDEHILREIRSARSAHIGIYAVLAQYPEYFADPKNPTPWISGIEVTNEQGEWTRAMQVWRLKQSGRRDVVASTESSSRSHGNNSSAPMIRKIVALKQTPVPQQGKPVLPG